MSPEEFEKKLESKNETIETAWLLIRKQKEEIEYLKIKIVELEAQK